MARPLKKGLDYFPKDVNYYDDEKIIELLEEYGPLGQTVYDAAITLVYKNGYYLETSAERLAVHIIRMIGNRWIKNRSKVTEILSFCADRGLLDKELMSRDVVTSRGIQKRYSEITARKKTDKSKYRLIDDELSDAETEVNAAKTEVNAAETGVIAAETCINAAKMPQSKVNKIKVNESKVPQAETAEYTHKYGRFVNLTDIEYESLVKDYGREITDEYVDRVDRYLENSGRKPYKSHLATIREWLSRDGAKPKSAHSYDLEKLVAHALNTTPHM